MISRTGGALAGLLVTSGLGACERTTPGTDPAVTAARAPIRVAAASDLADALPALAEAFRLRGGDKIEIVLGASGLLAKQLAEGAPFDAFASAATRYVDDVVQAGACDGASITPYAQGRLAVWAAPGVAPPATLADLAQPRYGRIAIANPEHAPYGKAAREALEHAGVWAAVERRVIRADNARAALITARSGNAEVAIVSQSLVITTDRGTVLPLRPELHAPIAQTFVACGPRATAARPFIAFVASPEGQTILARHGFAAP